MEKIEIRIGGLGGQGVVLAGQLLGRAAVYDGKNAVQTQTYGAEARGSDAKSEVIISNRRIGYPLVRKCDILVAMSQEVVEKNLKDIKEDGLLLFDDSTVKSIPQTTLKTFRIPATKVAENSFGEKLHANMVMLGALVQKTQIVSVDSMERAIRDSFPKKYLTENLLAFRKGLIE